jgi:hypothetical protein
MVSRAVTPVFLRWRPRLLAAVALGVLSLTPVVPLLFALQPWSADANDHLYRLVEFDSLLRQGVLYPRWAPDLGYGYGFPLFNYYPPLAYYLGAVLHAFVPDYFAALKLAFGAAFLLAGLGAWQLASQALGEMAGWLAPAAYVFSPYLVLNALQRGNLPETLSMGLAPWSVLGFFRLAQEPRPRRLLLPALATAAVGYTHTLSWAMLMAFLGSFTLFMWLSPPLSPVKGPKYSRRRLGLYLASALVLALAVASAYWLPSLAELRYVQSQRLNPPPGFDFHANFVPLRELLTPPAATDSLLLNQNVLYSLALPSVVLALLSLRARRTTQSAGWLVFFWLAVLVSAALMNPMAVSIWERISALRVLQFPWRLLAPATLGLAILAGAGLPRSASPWLLGAVVVCFGLWVLTWTFVPSGDLPLPPHLDTTVLADYEVRGQHIGTTSNADFLPVGVSQMPAPKPTGEIVDRRRLPAGSELAVIQSTPYQTQMQLTLPQPARLIYDQFAFPGWRAELDGQPIPVAAEQPSGLITIDLPAGSHRLEVRLEATGTQNLATGITLLGIIACVLAVFLDRRQPAPTVLPIPAGRGWAAVLVGSCLVLAVRLYAQNHVSPFYGTRLSAAGLVGGGLQQPIDFDGKLRLIGADVNSSRVASGGEFAVTLYWQAAQRLNAYYSITTVLLDNQGARVAQHDNEHPGGIWTTTWPTDHYVADVHRLAIPAGLPPGTYTLQVGVYRRDDLQPLPIQAPPDHVGAVLQPVAEIQVTRPFFPPKSADLPMDVRLTAPAQLDGLELLGYSGLPASVPVGGMLPLQFFWRAGWAPLDDWRVEVFLRSNSAAQIPVSGREEYPTTRWSAGEIVRASYDIPVSVLLSEGPAELAVRLVTADGSRTLPPLELGPILITVPPHTDRVPPMAHTLNTQFGPAIELLGFDLEEFATGIKLTLYWRSLAPAEANYTVFVHLLDGAQALRAQVDRPPLDGLRPTRGWIPGEVLSDPVSLNWPSGLTRGEYLLSIGLYDPRTGIRLPVGGTDSLTLTTINIAQ